MKPDITVIEKPVCNDLIKQLEETLQKAKTGEINGWVGVLSYNDNCTSHKWAGVKNNAVRLVGELYCAASDLAGNVNHN